VGLVDPHQRQCRRGSGRIDLPRPDRQRGASRYGLEGHRASVAGQAGSDVASGPDVDRAGHEGEFGGVAGRDGEGVPRRALQPLWEVG
jgi:hypothetical protein